MSLFNECYFCSKNKYCIFHNVQEEINVKCRQQNQFIPKKKYKLKFEHPILYFLKKIGIRFLISCLIMCGIGVYGIGIWQITNILNNITHTMVAASFVVVAIIVPFITLVFSIEEEFWDI